MIENLQLLKSKFKGKKVHIEFPVDWLMHAVTSVLILGASALLGGKALFGRTISCSFGRGTGLRDEFIDDYCFNKGIFFESNSTQYMNFKYPSLDVWNLALRDNSLVYKYFHLSILVQGLMFQVGHYFLKYRIGRMIESLVGELWSSGIEEVDRVKSITCIARFMTRPSRSNRWFICYVVLAHLLNMFLLYYSLVFIDFLTDGYLGLMIFSPDTNDNGDVSLDAVKELNFQFFLKRLGLLFPRIANCKIPKVSEAGTAVVLTGLCNLNMNLYNEIVVGFEWVWLHWMLIFYIIQLVILLLAILPISGPLLFKLWMPSLHLNILRIMFGSSSVGDRLILIVILKNICPNTAFKLINTYSQRLAASS